MSDVIDQLISVAGSFGGTPVADAEATETFPREVFRTLGRAGLLSLPYPEEYGGGGQPYEVYLQVLDLSDLDHLRLIAEEVAPALP